MGQDAGNLLESGAVAGDDAKNPIWRHWKVPVLFGTGFSAAQLAVFLVRFGSVGPAAQQEQWVSPISGLVTGLLLFFGGGLLAGLLAQRVLRGSIGKWRVFLLVALAIATPIALMASLVGGLLGPPFVLVYAIAPYLLLVGLPALARKTWRRLSGADGAGCACG